MLILQILELSNKKDTREPELCKSLIIPKSPFLWDTLFKMLITQSTSSHLLTTVWRMWYHITHYSVVMLFLSHQAHWTESLAKEVELGSLNIERICSYWRLIKITSTNWFNSLLVNRNQAATQSYHPVVCDLCNLLNKESKELVKNPNIHQTEMTSQVAEVLRNKFKKGSSCLL